MKTMWVDERVEATVEFPSGVSFPLLRAIRFRDENVCFIGPASIDRTTSALVYRAQAASGEYTIRFEPLRQQWVLEVARAFDETP